jgi:hypothetical protein
MPVRCQWELKELNFGKNLHDPSIILPFHLNIYFLFDILSSTLNNWACAAEN